MRPSRDQLLPVLLCGAVIVLFYGGLLVPGMALGARDIPVLHLPLRTAMRALVSNGAAPTWDPLEHGGQPLLSNPHYAAFYPLTWLLLWLPPIVAIHASVILHAALAFAGAWRLARTWGLSVSARALAAVGFTANGAFAALPGTLLVFSGFAWLPWAWSLAAPGRWRSIPRPLLLGGVLALQILNGDPAAVLVTWIGLGVLLVAPRGSAGVSGRMRHLGAALGLALLLASAQAVPAWARLRDSARGAGLAEESTVWSTRPLRLLEALNPRVFGDPARDEEDLYFGAPLNDKNYPFLQSIYPSCLLTSLGVATLLLGWRRQEDAVDSTEQIPERRVPYRALTLAAVIGLLLGLGRFDPIDPVLRAFLPFLDMLRYPEKLLLLTMSALVFAGAAGLDSLERFGEPNAASTRLRRGAIAVALTVLALDGAALALAWGDGATLRTWITHAALAPLPSAALSAAVAFARREMLVALLVAAATVAALAHLGGRRRLRGSGIVALVLLDLAYYGRRALPTVPVEDLTSPRVLSRQVLSQQVLTSPAGAQRIFSDALFYPHDSIGGFRLGTPGTRQIETLLDGLAPSSAATVGVAYALHRDFDLMLTGWGRQALAEVERLGPRSPALPALLAAWNVGTIVRSRSPEEQVREFRRSRMRPLPAELVAVPAVLPRWRFAQSAELEADTQAAFVRAADEGFDLLRHEILVGPAQNIFPALDGDAVVLGVSDRGSSVAVRYRARKPALFVAAQTFDDGWTARAEGAALETWPTAIGQLATLVPAAEDGVLELRYRDPWVRVGAATSVATLLACILAASRRHRLAAAAPADS